MEIDENAFNGDWSIGLNLYKYIDSILRPGARILEFGSGQGSSELGKKWCIQCVEHNEYFLGLYPNIDYIYGPIVNGWYDHSILDSIKWTFELILIDGPPGFIGRHGILDFIDKLNVKGVPIVVDDIHREDEQIIFDKLAKKLGRQMLVAQDKNKQFGVLIG